MMFQGFPVIWTRFCLLLGVSSDYAKPLTDQITFLCEKSCFGPKIKFFKQKILHVKSLWWQFAPVQESTKYGKSNDFLNNGIYWHIMIIPQTMRHKVNIKRLKIYENFKNTARLILYYFTSCKCIMVWWDSYINTHERIGCNFQGHNIRNVWRACKARHHYDVTNKCCIVTTTTSLVERTLTFSAINVVRQTHRHTHTFIYHQMFRVRSWINGMQYLSYKYVTRKAILLATQHYVYYKRITKCVISETWIVLSLLCTSLNKYHEHLTWLLNLLNLSWLSLLLFNYMNHDCCHSVTCSFQYR